jgi:hypothetical protein
MYVKPVVRIGQESRTVKKYPNFSSSRGNVSLPAFQNMKVYQLQTLFCVNEIPANCLRGRRASDVRRIVAKINPDGGSGTLAEKWVPSCDRQFLARYSRKKMSLK